MSDLNDLYQETILDHNKRPRNRGRLTDPDRKADGFNPLCGDRISVSIRLKGDVVDEVVFEGAGCAISTASASLMTECLKGKTLQEAMAMFEKFHRLVTNGSAGERDEEGPGLGKLEVFSGVCAYPARVKCATLAWHTVKAAIENEAKTISTE